MQVERELVHLALIAGRRFTIRKTADCLIAATCLEARVELYHNDRDFEAIAKVRGLKIYNPKIHLPESSNGGCPFPCVPTATFVAPPAAYHGWTLQLKNPMVRSLCPVRASP
jgi:hypothetical protein